MRTTTVYGLREVGDAVRYVGQTTRSLSTRLRCHLKESRTRDSRVHKWIRSVLARGAPVEIVPIVDGAVWNETEVEVIRRFRAIGVDLVNCSGGGEGSSGYRWSPRQLAEISAKRKGRVITPEWRENISRGGRGLRKPADFGAKVSKARKGMCFSEEHRRNIGLASRGRRFSMPPDARQKIAAAKRAWWAERRSNA